MPRLGSINTRRLIAALKRLGFYQIRQAGGHLQLKRANLLVTVPVHPGDLHPAVVRSILRQAHLSLEELRAAL